MPEIKALIFDLDGTLLNTIEDIRLSCNYSLAFYGLSSYTSEDYKLMVGDGVDKLIERCLKKQNADLSLFDSVKAKYLEMYQIHQFDTTAPYEGIQELLEFAKANNILCHVLSNKPNQDTVSVIAHFFEKDTFDSVTGKLPGIPVKPDPTLLFEILNQMNHIRKDEILYIGDTLTDMQTAKNAGLNKVGVLWGFRNQEELRLGNPEWVVLHPSEIISIIRNE